MDRNFNKLSYFLGISLGIFLSIFVIAIMYVTDNIYFKGNKINSDIVNTSDYEKTKNDLQQKDTYIKKLEEKVKLYEKASVNKKIPYKVKSGEKVVIDIKKDMTNEQIVNLLIQKGIYPHKNDLMMLLEMIRFDRYKYSNILQEAGYISSAYEFNKAFKELETTSYDSSSYLYSKGYVQDKESFMKIIYMLDINNNIKYGKKEFEKNSSLRKISDVLINS